MATRMQQRRGTAAQWTTADPILAAGEIGFETDTSQFKIGDGVNQWSTLSYFKNLEDLGGTLDDYIPLTQKDAANGVATLDANGYIPVSQLANVIGDAPQILDTLEEFAFAISDPAGLLDGKINTAISTEVTNRNTAIQSAIETEVSSRNTAIETAIGTEVTSRNQAITTAIGTHESDTTNVHGIADTAALATKTYADSAVDTHNLDTTNVHGISDTSALVVTTDSRLSDERTPVDGSVTEAKIASGAVTSAKIADGTIVAGDIADGAITSAKILDGTISNGDISATAAIAATKISGTAVTQADTGTVTSTMIADGTIVNGDINASAAIAQSKIANLTSDLAAKAPLADPTFTGTVNAAAITISGNLTVGGTTTTVNATNLEVTDPLIYIGTGNSANLSDLGLVGHFNNGTYQHTGLVRDHADGKWKLFSGVTTEPGSSTIDLTGATYDTFKAGAIEVSSATIGSTTNTELGYVHGVTSAIQTQIDAKAPKATPSFTGGVTVDSSGIIFTDGAQVKQGVPSLTSINQQSGAYTTVLTDRDKLVEVNSASGVTLTIPTNASVAYPVGTSIDILQTGTGQVTIAGAGGVTVNATPGLKLRTQWSSATLFKRATDTWVVYGDLSA